MILIGFGTGRCGTQSLASFLNQQEGFNITHEKVPLGWYPPLNDNTKTIEEFRNREGTVIGDIGYYWINHLAYMLKNHNVKLINIIRNDYEVIESFWTYKAYTRTFASFMENEWFGHPYHSDKPTKDAIAQMVKWYRYWEKELLNYYGSDIYRINVNDLNSVNKLHNLLDWLGVSGKRDMTLQHIDRKRI